MSTMKYLAFPNVLVVSSWARETIEVRSPLQSFLRWLLQPFR
jgi:hypothetical protein